MSEVKRYTESCGEGGGVVEHRSGEFVEFKQFEKAMAENSGYMAANLVLREEIKSERLRADVAVADCNEAERRLRELEGLMQMFIENSDDKDVVELCNHALKPAASSAPVNDEWEK